MSKQNKNIPSLFKDIEQWETNRRKFLRTAVIAGAASQIAWFISCSKQLEEANEYLSAKQSTILKSIITIIWPDDGNGPSAEDLNTFGYIMWVIGDTRWNPTESDYIIEGLDWIDEQSVKLYEQSYVDLDEDTQKDLIEVLAEHDWGDNWMSVMVTLVLESLLLDPIYGGNKDEKGWAWLEHVPGQPRPTEQTRVESFLNKYKPYDV